MTDIIIQGIYGRMGRALLEKIGARDDCRVVAGVDREAGNVGGIPVYAGFAELPCKGVIIDFSSPAGAVTAAQYGAENGLPCVICSTGLSKEDEAVLEAASAKVPNLPQCKYVGGRECADRTGPPGHEDPWRRVRH